MRGGAGCVQLRLGRIRSPRMAQRTLWRSRPPQRLAFARKVMMNGMGLSAG